MLLSLLYKNYCLSFFLSQVYARTTNSEATHPSFGPIKQLSSQISYLLDDDIQLFGENMFGVHSIEYDAMNSFFFVFAALRDQTQWLSWNEVTDMAELIGVPTVPLVARRQVTCNITINL